MSRQSRTLWAGRASRGPSWYLNSSSRPSASHPQCAACSLPGIKCIGLQRPIGCALARYHTSCDSGLRHSSIRCDQLMSVMSAPPGARCPNCLSLLLPGSSILRARSHQSAVLCPSGLHTVGPGSLAAAIVQTPDRGPRQSHWAGRTVLFTLSHINEGRWVWFLERLVFNLRSVYQNRFRLNQFHLTRCTAR